MSKTGGLLFLLLPLFFTGAWPAGAQSNHRFREAGRPFIRNFSTMDYHADEQNWAIAQDHRGVIYCGNGNGVLEFDGVSWRLIPLPNKNICRSLASDTNGRIYVGGTDDFGYLAPDGLGQMQFVSLLAQVPVEKRGFTYVWSTHVLGGNVYFQTINTLFRWTPAGAEHSRSQAD